MKRTQIQLDDQIYAALRRQAYEQGRSMSSLVREALAQSLGYKTPRQRRGVKQFSFIGAGRSEQKNLAPVSERHDEALAEVLARKPAR